MSCCSALTLGYQIDFKFGWLDKDPLSSSLPPRGQCKLPGLLEIMEWSCVQAKKPHSDTYVMKLNNSSSFGYLVDVINKPRITGSDSISSHEHHQLIKLSGQYNTFCF